MRNAFIASSRSLASLAVFAALAGCSSLMQPPAQIESGQRTTPAPTAAPNRSAPLPNNNNGDGAVVTPLEPSAPLAPSAPVRPSGSSNGGASGASTHVVQAGETLYRISVTNGLKYQDVAAWNQLSDYNIKVGQVLRLTPPDASSTPITPVTTASTTTAAPVPVVSGNSTVGSSAMLKIYPKALKEPYSENAARNLAAQSEGRNNGSAASGSQAVQVAVATSGAAASKPAARPSPKTDSAADNSESSTGASTTNKPAGKAADGTLVTWGWPAEGKIGRGFSDSNKGIDIPGKPGQPIYAAADGKVVYSGSGLRGYGKLIIIKHDKTFLSAYAHNSSLLVKEGQAVRKGQKIAEMGNTDADQVKLHFEIRRFGKPVDPAQYLDSSS
ncbi:peptidoglycan DD-metalloendopeptidase family protein [Crenobacter sp. SG2305]|uniref:peptidoglycan DD-metalloendopeptidase family protein n=1 Tax=Crenobacter oryzisoli TaxID=3056844 RepID=UPI0025AAE368|nr:peptidoglycan DD-metalloendopeptidase family protein [Crenobacter sp. SG2305]MDN0084904.1 peptidoglycan DD-metalloendopeptidase family protein [Crenobacter sp. SG2305]